MKISRRMRLGAVAAPVPSGEPPVNTLPSATHVTFYPSPGSLETYYRDLHTYILRLNDKISTVVGRPCFPPEDLELWRAFRASWVEFYSAGPSQWFTWFKDDVSRAQRFHERALQWEAFVVSRCGVTPLPATARPMGTPAMLEDSLRAAAKAAGAILDDTGASKMLVYLGVGAFSLAALYVGLNVWLKNKGAQTWRKSAA